MKKNKIILLELFAGIGGFHVGLKNAGITIDKCFFSEIDKHAVSSYKYNFKNAEFIGSVKSVRHIIRTVQNARKQGDHLVITFGSPCQDFSLAGGGKGLQGSKSSLIQYSLFLIKWLRPDIYIWENVKGAYSTNDGADYWKIVQTFANLPGYRHEQQLLDTFWVLPQNRERIYFIGHVAEKSIAEIFPFRESDEWNTSQRGEGKLRGKDSRSAATLRARDWKGGTNFIHYGSSQDQKLSPTDVASQTLNAGHFNVPKVSVSRKNRVKQINENKESGEKQPYQQNRVYDEKGVSPALLRDKSNVLIKTNNKKGYDIAQPGDTINLQNKNSKTRRGRVGVGVAKTLDTQSNQVVVVKEEIFISEPIHKDGEIRHYTKSAPTITERYGTGGNNVPYVNNIRRLTEIECERLQGFPDNWTKYGMYPKKNISQEQINLLPNDKLIELFKDTKKKKTPSTQRYKMVGNAVTTKMPQLIGSRIKFSD